MPFTKRYRDMNPEEKAKRDKRNAKKREMRKQGKIPTSDLRKEADKLARTYCKRDGVCQAQGYRGRKCSGRLEWAHCKGRDEMQIRHHPDNCFCLCWAHHMYFTSHPDHWKDWVEEQRPGLWQRMDDLLIEASEKRLKPDYEYWIDYYKQRVVA